MSTERVGDEVRAPQVGVRLVEVLCEALPRPLRVERAGRSFGFGWISGQSNQRRDGGWIVLKLGKSRLVLRLQLPANQVDERLDRRHLAVAGAKVRGAYTERTIEERERRNPHVVAVD